MDLVFGDQVIKNPVNYYVLKIKMLKEFLVMSIKTIGGEVIGINLVKELEGKLNIAFPKEYVDFIIKNNGAYVLTNSFKKGERIESINNFYKIQNSYEFSDERLPDKVIPFARDAEDNLICFDFRRNSKCTIVFWEHEEEISEKALSFVSNSFVDFLNMLFKYDE